MTSVPIGTRLTFTKVGHAYSVAYPDGTSRRLRSVTAISGAGRAPQLERWNATITAESVARDWDDLAALDPATRLERMRGYASAERAKAAMRGTAVHTAAESLMRGDCVFLSDDPEQSAMVEAYARWLEQPAQAWLLGSRPEVRVFLPGSRFCPPVAGTADLFAHDDKGRRIVLDLKTRRSGHLTPRGEWAAQMWAYGQGHLVGEDGLVEPGQRERPVAASAVMVAPDGVRQVWLRGSAWRQAGRMWDGLRRYQAAILDGGVWADA